MSENKKIKNATPCEYKGTRYRSKLEASVAKVLTENNIPFEYETVTFVLIPKFTFQNEKIRETKYTCDFKIFDNVLLEVKGFPNDAYRIKRKLIMRHIQENGYLYDFYEIKSITQLKKLLYELKRPIVKNF